jgi:hypothetical protein
MCGAGPAAGARHGPPPPRGPATGARLVWMGMRRIHMSTRPHTHKRAHTSRYGYGGVCGVQAGREAYAVCKQVGRRMRCTSR